MPDEEETKEAITGRVMRALELNAEYFGVPKYLLMENAGYGVALEVAKRTKPNRTVAVFCGLGGNGGDGFVAARHLASKGFKVSVIVAGKGTEIADDSALENWKAVKFLRGIVQTSEVCDSTMVPDITADVIVDALLGIGMKGKLRQPVLQMVRKINNTNAFRVAVDVPTGIDADTGEVLGVAVKADLTVTFHKTKKGLKRAKKHVGELVVKEIGLPRELERYAGPGDALLVTKSRSAESHKGDFGQLLVIGGSETFSGAPALVALSALRAGVDLAYVAAPEKVAQAISAMSANLIALKMEGEHLCQENVATLEDFAEKASAVVLGPGLGSHPETEGAVKTLIKLVENLGKPLLLDADGLKAFAKFKRRLRVPLVLTPHFGEYAILTGKKPPRDFDRRIEHVCRTAEQLGAVVLLKGATDIITNGEKVKLNFTGNPGMTVGGTGDVLSGIVGALLAQNADVFEAAVAGAFMNGAAGDFVFAEKGFHMVATDLLEWIPKVMNDPMSHLKVRESSA